MVPYDEQVRTNRTDAANECAQVFSHIITDLSSDTNLEAQNYTNKRIEGVTEDQISRGVNASWLVYRRLVDKETSRIVEEIGGKLFYSCHVGVNSGEPRHHIQCILYGSFQRDQFNDHLLLPVLGSDLEGIWGRAEGERKREVPKVDMALVSIDDS